MAAPPPTKLVAVDVGGTHARFAIAEVADGHVAALHPEVTFRTAEHAGFEAAWAAFAQAAGPLPCRAAIAFAGPVGGEVLKLTNNAWAIRPGDLCSTNGLKQLLIVNDFGAVAHAVSQLGQEHFTQLCGPDLPLPGSGLISIVGPGTGLGVAQLLRRDGQAHVIETEGGHIHFAPLDELEEQLMHGLRARHGRVSAERLASGPGLTSIYETLCAIERRTAPYQDEKALWTAALAGSDPVADAALERFCRILGAVAGDIALAQGAGAVVIAGGIGQRLADRLPRSGFHERFIAKGRYREMLAAMPVKLISHPQPGLFGAAAAFAQRYG